MKTYYEILGVPRDASKEEIIEAYNKKAKEHRVSMYQGSKCFSKKFRLIYEAYGVLVHSEKRRAYDDYLVNERKALYLKQKKKRLKNTRKIFRIIRKRELKSIVKERRKFLLATLEGIFIFSIGLAIAIILFGFGYYLDDGIYFFMYGTLIGGLARLIYGYIKFNKINKEYKKIKKETYKGIPNIYNLNYIG
ncbi:MAG: DnaJ domain-containing protein [Lachnospiraceae bacterium]|nr:DnaJ domain-containing protein [Lachnospiraceae bacterium]